MADLTKTITNQINFFGPAPSTKWGVGFNYTMTWGTSKWGEGTEDLITSVEKMISNSITPSDAFGKDVIKMISNSLSPTSETTYEDLQTSNGYFYVFVKPTTDAESRNLAAYTESTRPSASYTSAAVASTNWS